MMLTRRTCFLIFFFCCAVQALYGQGDSVVRHILPDSTLTENDSDEGPLFLKEVVIRRRFAIKMDRDTTFFTADSFAARQFDNLEELMRRIPGMQVTKDGNILYNGLPIRQVGIDGTPLLNFDPKRLLQLLRGRDVDQLKIYNLETTADNPGRFRDRQEKGLDIRLKEEAKRGYYGKLAAGAGKGARTQWDQSADLSSFTDERKVSAYVLSANTADQSAFTATELPWQDISSLPRGTPGNSTAGIFYEKKINKSLSVSGNYSMNRNTQDVRVETTERRFLPSGIISTSAQAHSGIRALSNSITLQAGYVIDSHSYVSLVVNGGLSSSAGSDNISTATNNEDSLISSSRLTNTYKAQNPNAALVLSYNKRFRRAGSLTCSFVPNRSSSTARTEQYSNLDLVASGEVQQFNQQRYNTESNRIYTMSADYKYPVSRQLNIGLNWQGSRTQSESAQETYDRYMDGGKQLTDTLNPLFSNHYLLRKVSSDLGAMLSFTGKKYAVRLGSELQSINWRQQDVGLGTNVTRRFANLVPSASIRMTVSKQSVMNISYQLQFTQPALSQIQPLVNNNDPMNILAGNPLLTQSSAHNTNAGYTFTSSDGRQMFHAGSSLSVMRKAISLGQYIDENGRRTSRYYNQDGNYTSNLSLNYDQSVGKRIRVSAGQAAGFSKTITIVNNEENKAGIQSCSSRFSLTYSKDTVLNVRLEAAASYMSATASLNKTEPGSMVNYAGIINMNYSLPFGGVSVGTSCSWNNIKGSTGKGAGFLIWNASIQRDMNKTKSLVMKLYVYDLLNRAKGYSFYNELNVQREERFNSIERFFLLGLIWHFTKR
jgi:hypothetical protein